MRTFDSAMRHTASAAIYHTKFQRDHAAAHDQKDRIFRLDQKGGKGMGSGLGEGYQKLKNRLISHGIPEDVIDELLDRPTIISYRKGSFVFQQGAPTDLVFWVSSGVVEILHPNSNGDQIRASILGPGELFGFVERRDHKGRPLQAFQARARTNVQAGLLVREHIYKVLMRQDPPLLLQIMKELITVWSEVSVRSAEFLGMNYSARLEVILTDLAAKFGAQESRGILIIPEFGHNDFAEMIGCSRPMVSRLIAEMISTGRLAQNGKHYILIDLLDRSAGPEWLENSRTKGS